jgi:hypothetical protein
LNAIALFRWTLAALLPEGVMVCTVFGASSGCWENGCQEGLCRSTQALTDPEPR